MVDSFSATGLGKHEPDGKTELDDKVVGNIVENDPKSGRFKVVEETDYVEGNQSSVWMNKKTEHTHRQSSSTAIERHHPFGEIRAHGTRGKREEPNRSSWLWAEQDQTS